MLRTKSVNEREKELVAASAIFFCADQWGTDPSQGGPSKLYTPLTSSQCELGRHRGTSLKSWEGAWPPPASCIEPPLNRVDLYASSLTK